MTTSICSDRSEAKMSLSPSSAEVVPCEWPRPPSRDELNPLTSTMARVFGSTRSRRPDLPAGTSSLPSAGETRRSSKPIPFSPPGNGNGVMLSPAARSNAPQTIRRLMASSNLPGQSKADLGRARSASSREPQSRVERKIVPEPENLAPEPGHGDGDVALGLDENFADRPQRPGVMNLDDDAAERGGCVSARPRCCPVEVHGQRLPPLRQDERRFHACAALAVNGRQERAH